MANLYADENVPRTLVEALRALGHDVLTAQDDGRANQGIPDTDVLVRAMQLGRCVLTNDRDDFHQLHRLNGNHAGIITFTDDPDRAALAGRIDAAITLEGSLVGKLIRIVRPP